jgi:hypothetical protein
MIEIRYAGAVVGRSAIVRDLDTQGMFLGTTEPMPVGTIVTLKMGEQTVEAKVAAVTEAQELARAGMRVRFGDPASAALFGTPASAPAEPEAPLETAPARLSSAAAVPQAVPPEPSRQATAAPSAEAGSPGRIVGASTESAAVAAAAEEAAAVPAGPPTESAGGEGGRKNRRNKRR